MSIGPITVRCASCDTRLLLSEALLGRIDGQAGKISCKRCAAKIRIDLRQARPIILGATVERGVVGHEQALALVPVTKISSLPPSLSEQPPLAGSAALAAPRLPMSTLDAFTVDGERRSSVPPPLPEDAPQHRVSMRPRGASITPHPPRPGTPSLAPAPPSKDLFDDLPGAPRSLPPPTLQVTEDGRLLNDADLGRVPSRSRRVAPWLLAAAATFALAGGAAAALGVPRVLARPAVVPQVSGVALVATRSAPEAQAEASAPLHMVLVSEAIEPGANQEAAASASTEAAAEQPVSTSARQSTAERAEQASSSATSDEPQAEAEGVKADASVAAPGAISAAGETGGDSAEEPPADLQPFDKSAAGTALNEATAHATQCRSASDPSGTALVVVTYAPSGRVTSATISGPPFAGTVVGGCIASRFRGARVPAFSGEMVTVSKTVVLQ